MTRSVLLALVGLMTTLSSCGWWAGKTYLADSERIGVPLIVQVEFDPSVFEGGLEFTDPCQQRRTLPLGDKAAAIFMRQLGLTFEQVHPAGAQARGVPVDGTVRLDLALKELDLHIVRQGKRSYPATVNLGGTLTYSDANGNSLFSKKLRTEVKDEVETDGVNCEVKGLDPLVQETLAKLAVGFKKNLADSLQLKRAASGRKPGTLPVTADSRVTAPLPSPVPPAAPPAPPMPVPSPGAGAVADAPADTDTGPPTLAFHALLRDESGDHILMSGETLTVEIEVTNNGRTPARNVAAVFTGSRPLMSAFPKPAPVGDLAPGESRRIKATGRLGDVSATDQAELIIELTASTPGARGVPRKKFVAAVRPAEEAPQVLSVDVDRTPRRPRGFEQKKAAAVAIGVGAFREKDVGALRYAAHDAEVMARYFQTVGGMPSRQVRVLTDDRALKEDVTEALETWLPEQVDQHSTVMVFFSGRAYADPATGAVSLFPFEGAPGSAARVYSLRRLHAALGKLPAAHAILILDVTLTEPKDPSKRRKEPVWSPIPALLNNGRLVQMLGVTGDQQAHEYPKGKHGLFTYYVLKGLAGEADEDRDGTVVVGELYDYARMEVLRVARTEFGNEQEPICMPDFGTYDGHWGLPLARFK
jgi:hypothetical protein